MKEIWLIGYSWKANSFDVVFGNVTTDMPPLEWLQNNNALNEGSGYFALLFAHRLPDGTTEADCAGVESHWRDESEE